MAPDEIFSYIPTPEHPDRLRSMLPTDSSEGLSLLAFYRNSFTHACEREDKNTADCILDIIIHLRYRLIKLGEFLEDPASHLFAIYYEQTLPCMLYGAPLQIDFSPSCDLFKLMDETMIDEGIEIASDAGIEFGDLTQYEVDSLTCDVDLVPRKMKAPKTHSAKRSKKGSKSSRLTTTPKISTDAVRSVDPPAIRKSKAFSKFVKTFSSFGELPDSISTHTKSGSHGGMSAFEQLPNLTPDHSKKRDSYMLRSVGRTVHRDGVTPEDLGVIDCDILDCIDDMIICQRGKEAVKLLEVLHPVDVIEDGTIRVKKIRNSVGYEAFDRAFRGCPSSRAWLMTRQL